MLVPGIGGNQTDAAIFEVDQQLGFVTIPDGSISFSLASDATPQLAANQMHKPTNYKPWCAYCQ